MRKKNYVVLQKGDKFRLRNKRRKKEKTQKGGYYFADKVLKSLGIWKNKGMKSHYRNQMGGGRVINDFKAVYRQMKKRLNIPKHKKQRWNRNGTEDVNV